jgi:hypothetical protein
MSEERRGAPRVTAYIAAEIDTGEGKQAIAITRDVSANGILVLTRLSLEVGQAVKLKVAFGGRDDRILAGKVVRQEELDPGESTLWHTKVALAVEPGDPVHAELLQALDERGRS